MNISGYKAAKEAFVSDITGTTITHVNLVSAVALCSIALNASIQSRFLIHTSLTLIVEWILLVLPLLLSMTLFANRPILLCLSLIIPSGVLQLLPAKRPSTHLHSQAELPRAPSPSHTIDVASGTSPLPDSPGPSRIHIVQLPALTIYRSHMMLMTILAILAVDFPVFPRSLAKCETFGVSLMDLGVGSFVFSQGVVSAIPILKNPAYLTGSVTPKIITAVKKAIPVILLGIVRVIMVKGTEYPEHESEYGTHWNFFFTLAFLPVLQIALHPVIINLPISLLGFAVALSHQMALSFTPLQRFTLNAARTNLISANKEGLVSLSGYLAIHLLGLSVGTVLLPPSPSDFRRQQARLWKQAQAGQTGPSYASSDKSHTKHLRRQDDKTSIELFSYSMLWWTCLGACYAFTVGGGISRRLANLPYVLWVTAYNTTFILCYLLLDISFSSSLPNKGNESLQPPSSSDSRERKAPALLEAINLNSLTLFLVANVATGLINLSIQTMYAPDSTAMLILSAYSFGICALAWACRGKRLLRL